MNEPLIVFGQISILSILGFVITTFINHLLSNRRDAKNKRYEQGQKVVDAFRPQLDALNQTQDDARLIMTGEAFNRHESAVRNFKPYLSWFNRFRINRAWHKLAHHEQDKQAKIPFYEQYSDFGELGKRRSLRPLIISRIEKVVSFARKQ